MATIENFLLRFRVDGQQAITNASNAVKGLSEQVNQFGANTGQVGNIVGGLIGRLGPLGAAAGTVGLAFAALGLRAVQLADEIADISDATGISAGALLNFKQSIIEAGGKADDFSQLAIKLNQSLGDAAEGNAKLQQTFKTLGVFVTDAGGNIRSTEVVLRDAIAKLAAIEDPAKRASLAVDLFGKSAARLDLTKLNALRDPVADADIKRLSEYQAAIDRVRSRLEKGLISFFGKAAEEAEKFADKLSRVERELKKQEEEAAKRGMKIVYGKDNAPLYETPMSAKEQAAFAERQRIAQMERLMAPAVGVPRGRTELEKPGGFGKPPEADLKRMADEAKANAKAQSDWELRLQASVNQTQLQEDLRTANQLQAISINAAAEVERARVEIFSRERLTEEQKAHEFAEKEIEIAARAQNERQKLILAANARIYAETQAQQEENARAVQEFLDGYTRANIAAQEQVNLFRDARKEQEQRANLEKELVGLDQSTADLRRKIFDLETSRSQQLKQLADNANLAYSDRLKLEQQVNDEINKAIELERLRAAETQFNQRSFTYGWEEALKRYAESTQKSADQARGYFETFARGFEDAFVRLVKTGKLSFKDLVNSMIAEFARLQAQKFFVSLFGNGKGEGGMLMNLFTWGKSLFGLANGGSAMAGTPYIVGERGPELFVPFSNGRVIANNAMGVAATAPTITNVNYTIQAVDAASFRQMVARDPAFIYAVTERGRASTPTRRIA